jgi:hypothetical protein
LGHIGPEAMDRRLSETKSKASTKPDKPRGGFMGKMMERAEQERKRRQGEETALRKPPPRTPNKGQTGSKKTGTGKGPKGASGRPKGSGPNRPKRPGR